MNYKELYMETKKMLEEFDFIDDSMIATLTYCENIDDLKLVHDFIRDKKYKNINDIPKYAFYRKRQVICWIENYFKKIDNYIEN